MLTVYIENGRHSISQLSHPCQDTGTQLNQHQKLSYVSHKERDRQTHTHLYHHIKWFSFLLQQWKIFLSKNIANQQLASLLNMCSFNTQITANTTSHSSAMLAKTQTHRIKKLSLKKQKNLTDTPSHAHTHYISCNTDFFSVATWHKS